MVPRTESSLRYRTKDGFQLIGGHMTDIRIVDLDTYAQRVKLISVFTDSAKAATEIIVFVITACYGLLLY